MTLPSPPYLKESASPRMLYKALLGLHLWAEGQLNWARNHLIDIKADPKKFTKLLKLPTNFPSEDEFIELSLADMHSSWLGLRYIRERHDDMIRNFEDGDLDGEEATFLRLGGLVTACNLLNVAFLPFEPREAKESSIWQEEIEKQIRKAVYRIKKTNKAFEWELLFSEEPESYD